MLCLGDPTNTPVVFLHGFMGAPSDWLPVIEVLSQRYYCLCPDLPGHATPCQISDKFSSDRQIERLIRQVSERVRGSFHLVGYSLGGRIAMMMAHRWPALVRSLTLESAHPGLPDELARAQRKIADESWANRFTQTSLSSVLEDWFTQTVYKSLSEEEKCSAIDTILSRAKVMDIRFLQQGEHARFHHRMAEVLMAFSLSTQVDFTDDLKRSYMPLLYVSGEFDEKFCDLGEQLAQGSRSLRHHIFSQSGHNVHLRHPESFAELLIGQLAL